MSSASFQMALLSIALLVGLIAIVFAARAGYRSAGRQMEVDDMLSRKRPKHYKVTVEAGSFVTVGSKANLLVKEGEDGDAAEAEKADD